jgi:transcriptional regulator with XRE-family HTH domain
MDPLELGQRVLSRRRELGLSQTALAKKASMSRNYVSLIERGEARNVSTGILSRLARVLGIAPAELMGGSEADAVLIPPSLREFGVEEQLDYDVVDRLARLPRRGQEPSTAEGWRELYEAVEQFLKDER